MSVLLLRGVPSYYLATFQGRILWADFWVRKEVKKKSILFFAVVAALITNFDTTVAWDHLCSFMTNEIKDF